MAEGAQCHCTFIAAISAIVDNLSPDFSSLNYSMRRLRIFNKKYSPNLSGNCGYGPEWLTWRYNGIGIQARQTPKLTPSEVKLLDVLFRVVDFNEDDVIQRHEGPPPLPYNCV